MNKKRSLLSLTIVLVAAVSMLLLASATQCFIGSVSTSQNVNNPTRITGAEDASYAGFAGGSGGSQLVGPSSLPVNVPSGANGWVYAYSAGSSTVNMYSASSSTGPWSYVGTKTVSTTPGTYITSGGSFPGTHSYIGIFNSGSYNYIDAGGAIY